MIKQSPFSLTDKTILVTGASSGIGRATAIALSQFGASVVLTGRSEERLNETLKEMKEPNNHFIIPFDLKETTKINGFMKEVISVVGRQLDGLVHSAGIQKYTPIRSLKIGDISDIFEINTNTSLMLLKSCMNKKIFKVEGSIVLISSISSLGADPGNISYAASKGAINAIVKTAAMEFVSSKIRVNGICPGLITTPIAERSSTLLSDEEYDKVVNSHPLGIGEPEDVAYGAVYLLSEASRWVTGTLLTIDGGRTC